MSATGSWVAQTAIVTALRADSTVAAAISGVFDSVPEDAAFPFVVVGEGSETDASSFGQVAHTVTPEIQVWTRDGESIPATTGAAGYKIGLAIADAIVAAILADGFTVEGHDTIVMPLREMLKERPIADDPSIRLVAPKFELLLEDSSS